MLGFIFFFPSTLFLGKSMLPGASVTANLSLSQICLMSFRFKYPATYFTVPPGCPTDNWNLTYNKINSSLHASKPYTDVIAPMLVCGNPDLVFNFSSSSSIFLSTGYFSDSHAFKLKLSFYFSIVCMFWKLPFISIRGQ